MRGHGLALSAPCLDFRVQAFNQGQVKMVFMNILLQQYKELVNLFCLSMTVHLDASCSLFILFIFSCIAPSRTVLEF